MTSKETHQELIIFPNDIIFPDEHKVNLNFRGIAKTWFPVWSDSCYTQDSGS